MSDLGLIAGSHTFLRRRNLHDIVTKHEAKGIRIDYVDATERLDLLRALDGNPFLSERTLVIVEHPEKGDLELYKAHIKDGNEDVALMLHFDGDVKGNTKFGKFAKTLGKQYVTFPEPKAWNADKEAAAFVQAEVKLLGKTITERLAQALVHRVGNDFGVLAYELRKMAALADANSSDAITKVEVKGGMAELAELSAGRIMDAFRVRNEKQLIKALDAHYKRSSSDPTMLVVRMIYSDASKWLQAVSLSELPPKDAAAELFMNPWYFENKVLPVAKAWGERRIIHLLKRLALCERAVLGGHVSPWIFLCSMLLSSCRSRVR